MRPPATRAPTPTSASRPAPHCFSTAAPTSWSRRRTPAAMTSSRIWSPARLRSAATRKPKARPGSSTASTRAPSPGTGNPTNAASIPTWPRAAKTAGPPNTSESRPTDPFRRLPSPRPFEADAGPRNLRLRRPDSCSPCFADGSTGADPPPNGELVQGMTGSLNPGPAPNRRLHRQAALGRRQPPRLRLDPKFEPDGNEGEISIYDRDLKRPNPRRLQDPGGQTMHEEGRGIGELDISSDGSRILIGQLVSKKQAPSTGTST